MSWNVYPGNGCVYGIVNGYVIGCAVDGNGNSPIFKVTSTGYQLMTGTATRIYTDVYGQPWILTNQHGLSSWDTTNEVWMSFGNTGNAAGQTCVKGAAIGVPPGSMPPDSIWILTCDDTVRRWIDGTGWSQPMLGWNATTPDPWGIGDIALMPDGCRYSSFVVTGHDTICFITHPTGPLNSSIRTVARTTASIGLFGDTFLKG